MIKFLINIVELVIIAKISWKLIIYFLTRKFRKKTSKGKNYLTKLEKVNLLISRRIDFKLNEMLKTQKIRLGNSKSINTYATNQDLQTEKNVINLKKYKSKKVN